jgi:hypothetical protein
MDKVLSYLETNENLTPYVTDLLEDQNMLQLLIHLSFNEGLRILINKVYFLLLKKSPSVIKGNIYIYIYIPNLHLSALYILPRIRNIIVSLYIVNVTNIVPEDLQQQ